VQAKAQVSHRPCDDSDMKTTSFTGLETKENPTGNEGKSDSSLNVKGRLIRALRVWIEKK